MTEDKLPKLPKGWEWVHFKDICTLITKGSTPTSYGFSYKDSGISFIRTENINKSGNIVNVSHYIDEEANNFLKRSILQDEDILFSIAGTIGRAGIVTKGILPANTNQALAIIRANWHLISQGFIFYYLKSPQIQEEAIKSTVGVGRANISLINVNNFPLPLSPLNEQQRILGKIEELFTRLDAGVESLKKVQVQMKRYRQAILKHAFEGNLTAVWRKNNSTESADSLLLRIREERQKYQLHSKNNSRFLDKSSQIKDEEFDDLPTLPDNWKWVKLGSIAEKVQIGPFGSLLHKDDYIANGIPLINPSHIKNLSVCPDNELTISSTKADELENYVLAAEDIIMGRRGEMGRCAVITKKEDGYMCGTGCLFIRLPNLLSSKFYSLILSSERIKSFLDNNCLGTTMKNLNQGIIKDIAVPLCSLEEQLQIVQEIERRFSIADRIEEIVGQNLKKAERLRQSILKKAFEGKLVHQNPSDEPTAVLLERIKAEKEKCAGTSAKGVIDNVK